jgi:hypothetical protein
MEMQLKLVTLESNTKRRLNDVTPDEWDKVYSALADNRMIKQNRSLLSTSSKTKKVLH